MDISHKNSVAFLCGWMCVGTPQSMCQEAMPSAFGELGTEVSRSPSCVGMWEGSAQARRAPHEDQASSYPQNTHRGLAGIPKVAPSDIPPLTPLPQNVPHVPISSTGLPGRGGWSHVLHPPVWGGAAPREVLGAERGGPWCHGLLDGSLLAVGLEERRRSVGQHRPLVTAELGPPVLKPNLYGEGEALTRRGSPRCPSHRPDPGAVRGWGWRGLSHLDSGLAEVHPPGQLLPHEGVGVMCPLKDPLQSLQLAAVECGAVPPLLLLPLGHPTARAQALTWGKSQQKAP